MGRPSKLKDIDLKEVEKLGALGLTDMEISSWLGINRSTLSRYKAENQEFQDTIKRGKQSADANVVRSLYKKATGGDTTACIFWLKNRRNQDWKDIKAIEHSGHIEDKAPDLSKFTKAELLKIAEMTN